jgi:hypothetical protein
MANSEALEDNVEAAEDIAHANLKLRQGIVNLNSNWEKYGDIVKSLNKENPEYAKGLEAIRQDMADILNIDISDLSNSFFESAENLKLMQQAAEGDLDAIIQL